MSIYHGYQGAKSCTSGPQPGARGAMDWFIGTYGSKGGVNLGIYNCRSVRGGSTTSLHGEGRATDFGIRPLRASYGTALADQLRKNSKELGIQCIIWNRKIWSGSYPNAGWRKYTGAASHYDHLHVELTWAMAKKGRNEVAKLWAKILGGTPAKGSGGSSGGSSPSYRAIKYGEMVKLYTKGNPVKDVQRVVGVKADGFCGPDTVAAIKTWQAKHGLAADGIVGPDTWKKMKPAIDDAKKKPRKSNTAPKFPLAKGHWYGVESSNKKNHSGYHAKDRAGIKQFQSQLKKRGWKISADGRFGPSTKKVVQQFQKEKGLKADGLVGASTWKKIWEAPVT